MLRRNRCIIVLILVLTTASLTTFTTGSLVSSITALEYKESGQDIADFVSRSNTEEGAASESTGRAKQVVLHRSLLTTKGSLPLVEAVRREAAAARDREQQVVRSGSHTDSRSADLQKVPQVVEAQQDGEAESAAVEVVSIPITPPRANTREQVLDSEAVKESSSSRRGVQSNTMAGVADGSEIYGHKAGGGLRGHLERQRGLQQPQQNPKQLPAKGTDPILNTKGQQGLAVGRTTSDQLPDEDDMDLPDDIDDDDTFSSWWPLGRRWQPPIKPFVVQRPVRQPGSLAESRKGTFEALTEYLPGRKAKPGIPKIFHQVYLAGEEALLRAEEESALSGERWPSVKSEWRRSCKALHPGWEFWLWNATAMEDLLAQHYPWFLPTYKSYPQSIHRVDAVRPFIMHQYGGIYVDMDVECLQAVDGFLEDHELVFQEEDFGQKSLVNSAIAGVPQHYFWSLWQQVIYERAPQLRVKRGFFSRADHDVISTLNATGPWALRAAFARFSKDYGLLRDTYIGSWKINETNVMVYPLGTWFVPCLWDNKACHMKVEGLASQRSLPIWLAGHHKNAGSWFQAAGFSRSSRTWGGTLTVGVLLILVAAAWFFRRKRWQDGELVDRWSLPRKHLGVSKRSD